VGKIHESLLKIACALVLLFSGFNAFAQWKSAEGGIEAKVEKTLARLEAVQSATSIITENTFGIVQAAMEDTFQVLNEIVAAKMPDDKKAALAEKVTGKMGETFFRVIRHHGVDIYDVDGKVNWKATAKQTLREIMTDASVFFTFPKDVAGNRTWGPREMARRERLSQEMIAKMRVFTEQTLNVMDQSTDTADLLGARVEYLVDRALKIRAERAAAQNNARNIYLGLAIVLFLNPPVDLAIERTYYSTFTSSLIYFSAFMAAAITKTFTNSVMAIKMLKELAAVIITPEAAAEKAAQARRRTDTEGRGQRCAAIFAM
jgi:hypothetical protein